MRIIHVQIEDTAGVIEQYDTNLPIKNMNETDYWRKVIKSKHGIDKKVYFTIKQK
jgi:hypothetical protein